MDEPVDTVEQSGDPETAPVVSIADTFTTTSLLVTTPQVSVEMQTT